MEILKLPSNFDAFMPIINYYRHTLNINCLSTIQEQFLFYMHYHQGIIKKDIRKNVFDSYDGDLLYSYDRCFISRWKNKIDRNIYFNVEKDRMDIMSLVKPEQIDLYLRNLYLEHYQLAKLDNIKKYVNINCNDVIIKLDKAMLNRYSNFYDNTHIQYKYNEIKINIQIDEITARCIEDLINNENMNAILNAKDLLAYYAMIDYLDINLVNK